MLLARMSSGNVRGRGTEIRYFSFKLRKQPLCNDLQPMSMTQIEKIFSELVFGEMFPKPTLVRLLKVK